MKFGTVPISEAEGTILAHNMRLTERVLKKGHLINADDVNLFADEGFSEITVSRLEVGDIAEDEAAKIITKALAGNNIKTGVPFTGRCNLFSETFGLMRFDADKLDALNMVDESVTIATASPFDITTKGQLVATIKIIPFAISESILNSVIEVIAGKPLISIAPFEKKSVGLIITRLPGMKESILDKTIKTVTNRIEEFGSRLSTEIRCTHTQQDVTTAIKKVQKTNVDILLIFGASAVVDREDVLPAAVIQAGGRVDHFGMPVDPGNLLFIGGIGDTPVVGMPGCARSPKLNGFDLILWRLLANIPVKSRDIMLMGSGGLLKEISERGQLREIDESKIPLPREPKIFALLLAAGSSLRMGKENKLLADLNGTTMVARVAEQIGKSKAAGTLAVIGHEANKLKQNSRNW